MESLHAGSASGREKGHGADSTAGVFDEGVAQTTDAAISGRDLDFFYDEAGTIDRR
jgi:hypothetical protein